MEIILKNLLKQISTAHNCIMHSQRLNLRHELTGCPNGISPRPNFHFKQGECSPDSSISSSWKVYGLNVLIFETSKRDKATNISRTRSRERYASSRTLYRAFLIRKYLLLVEFYVSVTIESFEVTSKKVCRTFKNYYSKNTTIIGNAIIIIIRQTDICNIDEISKKFQHYNFVE